MWLKLVLFVTKLVLEVDCAFYVGRIEQGINELIRLNGRMTGRQAILKCELDRQCAGFSYQGPVWDLDTGLFHMYFYRFVPGMYQQDPMNFDWSTYLVDRQFAVYENQRLQGPHNRFAESSAGYVASLEGLTSFCLNKTSNCSAISVSTDGQLIVYSHVNLKTFVSDPHWVTILNLRAKKDHVTSHRELGDVDFCCPDDVDESLPHPIHNDIQDNIPRAPCSMSEDQFVNEYVRTGTPVILTGCAGYAWIHQYDLSLDAVTRMYFDNTTTYNVEPDWKPPVTGFTHSYTPNDHYLTPAEGMDMVLHHHYIRLFQLMRNNPRCQVRNNTCRVFERIQKPVPIPPDLYKLTSYENVYNWVIFSGAYTGSHPHNDPDLSGAWNYMINGYKYWAIFPPGVKMKDVDCNVKCSPGIETDVYHTLRWFKHMLPQLRTRTFCGRNLMEGVQRPGEVIYLPKGLTHSVLNIADNVAVTENYLFVDAMPELAKMIALDEISIWRPNWDELAWKKLYYGGNTNNEDRRLMRLTYDQVVRKVTQDPGLCQYLEKWRVSRYREKFFKNSDTYGLQNGNFPIPEAVLKYSDKDFDLDHLF